MSEEYIENRTFDEIHVGDSQRLTRTLTSQDLYLFAAVSGDVNPMHVGDLYAQHFLSGKLVGHSLWGGASFPVCSGPSSPVPGPFTSPRTCGFSARCGSATL